MGAELPGYAALKQQLVATQKWAATTIGISYHDVVSSINKAVNPFQAIAKIEGPLATQFNGIVNASGATQLLNRVIDPVLNPATAWAEDNVLFPRTDTGSDPVASAARKILAPVAPNLGTALGGQRTSSRMTPTPAAGTVITQSDSLLHNAFGNKPAADTTGASSTSRDATQGSGSDGLAGDSTAKLHSPFGAGNTHIPPTRTST